MSTDETAAKIVALERPPLAKIDEFLKLDELGRRATGARIIGEGRAATADVFLDDGGRVEFEDLRDFARVGTLNVTISLKTGVDPQLTQASARKLLIAIRQVAGTEGLRSADERALDWGLDFLQEAGRLSIDMRDQGDRWRAFRTLGDLDPWREVGLTSRSFASACSVLEDRDGTLLVRTGWFREHVWRQHDRRASAAEIPTRMERVGWERRGRRGRIKASSRTTAEELVWSFYDVPNGWEARALEEAGG